MNTFEFIKGKQFFSTYASQVTNWRYKMAGKDGHGKPIEFTPHDKNLIKAGVKKMAKDIEKATP